MDTSKININDIKNYNNDDIKNLIKDFNDTSLDKDFTDFNIYSNIIKINKEEEELNNIHDIFFYYSKNIFNNNYVKIDINSNLQTTINSNLNTNITINDNNNNNVFYNILNIITQKEKKEEEKKEEKNFFNILYIYLVNKLINNITTNKYEYIIQLYKKIIQLNNNKKKLLYYYFAILKFDDDYKKSLLSYNKIQIKKDDIKNFLKEDIFKLNDTVIIDPAGLVYMKGNGDKPLQGVSKHVKDFLISLKLEYPCKNAKKHFKDIDNQNQIYEDNGDDKKNGAFLCNYTDKIKIIHAVSYNFINRTVDDTIKTKLKIIYNSIFNLIKSDTLIKKIILTPLSSGQFAGNYRTEILNFTYNIIMDVIKEVYGVNDIIPTIILIAFNDIDLNAIKKNN